MSYAQKHKPKGFAFLLAGLVLTCASTYVQAQIQVDVRLFTSLSQFNAAVLETAEVFATSATNIAKADEQGSAPTRNRGVGAVQNPGTRTLTFNRANTDLGFDFEFTALKAEAITFDDDEGASNNLPNFDNALSPGDIDNGEDDDWSVRVTAPSNRLRAFGFFLQDNNSSVGESIQLLTSTGVLIEEIPLGDALPTNGFVGVVSSVPFAEIRYDEDTGGDDIAVKDFYFVEDRLPTAIDVFAATPINTAASPQSITIPLEGSDFFAQQTIRYTILSTPSNGALTDSVGQAVTAGSFVSEEVIYTPNPGVTGIDNFEFQAFAANAFFGRIGTSATATINVFDTFRPTALQLGGDIDGETTGDTAGEAVALSKDGLTLAVGASFNDGGGISSGHARVFRRDGARRTQVGGDINGSREDEFGNTVALSSNGDFLAVGARLDDNDLPGYVRVFEIGGNGWESSFENNLSAQSGAIGSSDTVESVSLSSDGRTLAIGLNTNDDEGTVRVFRWSNDDWALLGRTIRSPDFEDQFGKAISLSGDGLTLAVGAPFNDGSGANGGNTGQVRVYRFTEGEWQQLGGTIDGEDAFGLSGSSVSLSSNGNIVAIGAPRDSTAAGDFSGQVRVFQWNGLIWEQLGAGINGAAGRDEFGQAVSLSSNGEILAIGAIQRGFADGTPQEGYARVVQWTGSSWVAIGSDISGAEVSDDFGAAVSLSGDGQTLAVGAPRHGQFNRGHVRLFDLTLSDLEDDDADGLPNGQDECDSTPIGEADDINSEGCGPSERDSDNDGVNDRDDLFPDDPLDFADSDGDGLGDNREVQLGTNPQLADTDNDGFTDFEEVQEGTDPLSSDDPPAQQ
ncbi:MAG: hypothetical protein AAGI88_15525, partial [Pseudomonadota bacterium]